MTSGRNASSDANTKASTRRAPRAPSRVSASTPGPPESSPTASASMPVTPTVAPGGFVDSMASRIGSVGSSCVSVCGNG